MNSVLNRVDRLSPWSFTGSLYLARWVVVIPAAFAVRGLESPGGGATFDASAVVLFFNFLVQAPIIETLLECAAPYWLMRKARAIPVGKRPWGFVAVSALLMALMHSGAWPAAILPSLMTGSFLAYTFGHFAPRGFGLPFLHTCAFHAAINAIGWIQIVFSR